MEEYTSTWLATASLPRFPRPSADVRVDVAIVGGGITGLTAGYLLKRAGLKVAVLERGRCAHVDTGRTTAHLTSVTDARLRHLRQVYGPDVARLVWDAGGAAIDQIDALVRGEEIACDFRWVPGYLHAPPGARSAGEERSLRQELAAATALGISARYLAKVPFFGQPGIEFPHQALFHPVKYLSALARAIPGRGSHVFERANADEIAERPLAVKTGGHTIRAPHLILATHNPLQGRTGTPAALLFQSRLSLYTSYALGARVASGLAPAACFWDTGDPYRYLRVEPRRGGDYAVYGGEDHKTGQVRDTRVRYDRLERTFRSLFPAARVEHRWSGQVISTNDGLPLIGETAPHQFVATGFAGNGMTFGTLGAMMAADSLLGRKNPWRELFDVHRAKVRGGTWDYLRENADYPYYLVRNWLARSEGKSVKALRRGQGKILNLGGKKVAAYRSDDGKVSLCSPICTHLQCVVDWNNAERTWDCPCHGSRFRPTGEVISGPAEEPLARVAPPAR
jgi:glycine/D-amino acid oxidase-like deaminating enzyme/nitrite reductase/ring-hydroxylating ferredoxin subunit